MSFPCNVKVIGGHEYKVTALPARRSRRLLTKLAKSLGPGFASGDMAVVCENLDENLFDEVCDMFASVTTVDETESLGRGEYFDLHFAQRYGDLFLWLKFCLESEYGGFLDVFAGLAKDRPQNNPASPPKSSE